MLMDNDMPVDDLPPDEGNGAPRQSYNFAPGYHGIVYRADTPDWGAGPHREARHKEQDTDITDSNEESKSGDAEEKPEYKLQSMKWGLIPFWTKRNPDYGTIMRSINCRDDSLSTPGGMWATMKARKRCIVIAQGFFEWLKTGPKDKLPHFIRRRDGGLMCFAGLWDCVKYEGKHDIENLPMEMLITMADSDEKTYTYTVITTDANKQMKFIHDRMPVILDPGSEQIRTWLNPQRHEWSKDLQNLLKPFAGELDIYPVSKEVGKVGNNSPSFIIPLDSKENKSNIANFFANAQKKSDSTVRIAGTPQKEPIAEVETEEKGAKATPPRKRQPEPEVARGSPPKKQMTTKKISATNNQAKTRSKTDAAGSQKITKFFGNSA